LLERLGLAEHADKPVPALSGGLKQRLALAIALLADPPVLLLDEPTANLDAAARYDYLALLGELRRDGKTLIFASHRLEEVEALAGQVLLLQRGQLAEVLTPAALRVRLAPEVQLTLWVAEGQRPQALACLQESGLDVHLNGRGTVVARVHNGQKAALLHRLHSYGIPVTNFEMEEVVKREA
jgi:ABC-type multidrug transport system ATPase subunit